MSQPQPATPPVTTRPRLYPAPLPPYSDDAADSYPTGHNYVLEYDPAIVRGGWLAVRFDLEAKAVTTRFDRSRPGQVQVRIAGQEPGPEELRSMAYEVLSVSPYGDDVDIELLSAPPNGSGELLPGITAWRGPGQDVIVRIAMPHHVLAGSGDQTTAESVARLLRRQGLEVLAVRGNLEDMSLQVIVPARGRSLFAMARLISQIFGG